MNHLDKKVIKLERHTKDRLVPKDFYEIIAHRFFPVLSLTYVGTIIGIAAEKGSVYHYVFEERTAYTMALIVAAWVSVPAIIWIMLNESPLYAQFANLWYKIISGLMLLTLMVSFLLFPEANVFGLRVYFAATMPVFVIMYIFFVKGGLPAFLAHPLTAIGLTALIHGAVLNLIHPH